MRVQYYGLFEGKEGDVAKIRRSRRDNRLRRGKSSVGYKGRERRKGVGCRGGKCSREALERRREARRHRGISSPEEVGPVRTTAHNL